MQALLQRDYVPEMTQVSGSAATPRQSWLSKLGSACQPPIGAKPKQRWELTEEDGTAVHIMRITESVWVNVGGLALFGVMVGVLAVFTGYVLYLMVRTVRRWHVQRAHAAPASATPTAGPSDLDDDLPRRRRVGKDGLQRDLPSEGTVALLRRRMTALEAKYKAYNAALGAHVAASKQGAGEGGVRNDDVIDARILSDADATYKYRHGGARAEELRALQQPVVMT